MAKSQMSITEMESCSRWSMSQLWDWIKRSFTTSSQKKRKDLLEVFAAQNERLIKLLEKQQATIDRVIQAKFDVPLHSAVTREQIESKPAFPPYMMSDFLNTERDEDFLAKAEQIVA